MVVDSLNEGMPQSFPIDIGVALAIYKAIGVYMHWVILGMELEYQALGYNIYPRSTLLTNAPIR